jgi:hypothetical protein
LIPFHPFQETGQARRHLAQQRCIARKQILLPKQHRPIHGPFRDAAGALRRTTGWKIAVRKLFHGVIAHYLVNHHGVAVIVEQDVADVPTIGRPL